MIFDNSFKRLSAESAVTSSPQIMTLEDPAGWRLPGMLTTPSATRAMKIAAVSACVDIRSDSIGKMPFFVMNSETKERDRSHYLSYLLSTRPNRLMTPFVFKKLLESWRLMKGNAYVWVARNSGTGIPEELIPLNPDLVEAQVRKNGEIVYVYRLGGKPRDFMSDDIIHLKGFSDDGIIGQSVLSRAAEVISAAGEQQRYEGKFYQQSARPGGLVYVDSDLSTTSKDKFREEWEKIYGGSENAYRIAVLDNGMKYQSIAMTQRDAQFVESRDMSVADIARFFLVPLYKLQAGKQTYESNEQNAVEYVVTTLTPAVTQWEEEFTFKGLFDREIKESKVVKANMNVELRGDTESRVRWYKGMRDVGAYSPNEIRALEDLEDVPGGDLRIAPLNSIPLEQMDIYFDRLMERGKAANQGGDTSNEVI